MALFAIHFACTIIACTFMLRLDLAILFLKMTLDDSLLILLLRFVMEFFYIY